MTSPHTPRGPRVGSPLAWGLVAVAGQAATLQCIVAGKNVSYQHYAPLHQMLASAPRWALLVLAIECLGVMLAGRQWLPVAARWLARQPRWHRVALLAFVATSATVSRSMTQFAGELFIATLLQAVHLAVVLCFALSLRPSARMLTALQWRRTGPESAGIDRFALGVATWVTVVSAMLAFSVYDRHPHVPDEVAYLLQAKMIARGMLSLPSPPVPAAFDVDLMMIQDGRWFSVMPSGWSFVLALGVVAKLPWLVNPLLAGGCVLMAYLVAQHFVSRRAARLSLVLLGTSPWFLFMAMSLMSHTASLLVALTATHAAGLLRTRPRVLGSAACGIATGLVAINRPLEGLAVAGLMGLWVLTELRGWVRARLFAVLVVATGMTASLTLAYNRALSGSARVFPVTAYMDAMYGAGKNDLGFGANRGLGWVGLDPFPGHDLRDVLINADLNLTQINFELLGWSTGSLLLVLILLASGRLARGDWQLLSAIVAVIGIHSFYWFSGGPDFGARYWYLTIFPFVVLSARGIEVLCDACALDDALGPERVLRATALLAAASVLTFMPWRAVDKYRGFRGMRADVRSLAQDPRLANALVLVHGKRHPDFASAVVYNDLDLTSAAPVFVWDRDAAVRDAVLQRFASRPVWILDGPSVTGGAYRLRAGPLSTDARRDRSAFPSDSIDAR